MPVAAELTHCGMVASLLTGGPTALEFGEYVGTSAIVVSIFLATVVFIWQSGRSDARIDRLGARIDRLDAKIEAQGDRITTEIRAEIREQNRLIEEQGRRIDGQGKRVSEVELEQARLNGVNSVIVNQIHSHEG